MGWSGLTHLHRFLLKCPSAHGFHVCKMHRISCRLMLCVFSSDLWPLGKWNENGQVLVWNLCVLQLTSERRKCLTDVLTSTSMAYCKMLVLFQSLSQMILGEALWNLIWHFGSSMQHMPVGVPCIQDAEVLFCLFVFAVTLCIFNLGRKTISSKIIWGKIIADKIVLASVAAYRSLSTVAFFWKKSIVFNSLCYRGLLKPAGAGLNQKRSICQEFLFVLITHANSCLMLTGGFWSCSSLLLHGAIKWCKKAEWCFFFLPP